LKTLSSVETFENATNPDTCGRTVTGAFWKRWRTVNRFTHLYNNIYIKYLRGNFLSSCVAFSGEGYWHCYMNRSEMSEYFDWLRLYTPGAGCIKLLITFLITIL
jgi:hypothetical protein